MVDEASTVAVSLKQMLFTSCLDKFAIKVTKERINVLSDEKVEKVLLTVFQCLSKFYNSHRKPVF